MWLTASKLPADQQKIQPPDRVIEIPMRDGVKLPANVYVPRGHSSAKFTCVLVRHPLGKDAVDPQWLSLVKAGYALVIQSTRSSCDDSGKAIPYLTDGWSDDQRPADGYDTVQWLATADFCNGSVSTIGVSATGITEFLLAPSSPPNLCCQFIEMAAPSMYQYAIYPGGQFRKEQVEGWMRVHRCHPSLTEWIKGKSSYDAFWTHFNSIDYADQIHAPQMHVGGWFDIFLQGTVDAFFAAQQHSQQDSRSKHKLIVGPWGHRWRHSGKLGDFVLTDTQSTPPVNITQQAWLDHHARGLKNEVDKAPTVQYYVMGPFDGSPSKGNLWRTADTWPPQGAEYNRFFISCDGKLSFEISETQPIDVAFDAKNPVPTIGGRNLFMPDGPRDLKPLMTRKDVKLFLTDVLTEDVEVTGRLWANVYLADVQRERDVCLRLVDVWPSGEQYLIAEGISHIMPRRKYEYNVKDPQLVVVDLWSTSMVFAKGHRLGLVLSASNYPAYDISFVSDEDKGIAFSVHSTKKFPSSLALPIMKTEDKVVAKKDEHSSMLAKNDIAT